MIATFILLLFICPAICVGFYACCDFERAEQFDKLQPEHQKLFPVPEGEDKTILWFVRYYLGPVLGKFWCKPVYQCLPCMGSLHSILPCAGFILYNELAWYWLLIVWPFIALITSGINYMIQIWWAK